ncbi:MAG: cell division protein SepF [Clostridiales bacterium]|nr:cell division protein SepF [Clostridiales bacterium]
MAGIFRKIVDNIFVKEEDFDDDYEEEYLKEIEKQQKKSYRNDRADEKGHIRLAKGGREDREATKPQKSYSSKSDNNSDRSPYTPGRIKDAREYDKGGYVPQNSGRKSYSEKTRIINEGSEISIYNVENFSDAREVCDKLVEGSPIIVNFTNPASEDSQRVMDFIAGCIYVIDGNLHVISNTIFLFSPNGIDVSGDYLNMVQGNAFGVPTFNKMI